MKLSKKPVTNGSTPFNENFNCNKMKLLVAGEHKESFSEKFNKWLQAYTKPSREKIWVDIESYHAG